MSISGGPRQPTRRPRIVAALMVLASLWLLSPLLYSQHLEGYTTNLKAIALMANRGDMMGQDLMSPALTEFLYYTRTGVIALLRLSEMVFGNIGDWDFRILMILSFGILCVSSIFIARRLGDVPAVYAAASLLLIPSVSENAFFFNDSLPSAAFAVGAIALLVLRDRLPVYALAGGLIACAAFCRLDAMLVAPAVAGVAWMRHTALKPIALRLLAASAGFCAVLVLAAVLLKATPLDAYLTGRNFLPGPGNFATFIILGLAVGAPGALLLPIGLVSAVREMLRREDRVRWFALLVLHPLLIVAVALKISTETRYIYPLLAPYFALYGGKGLEVLMAALRGRFRRAGAAGLVLLALFVLVPPPFVVVRDGPRSPLGRLWMPALWLRWETTMAQSLHRVDELVRQAGETRLLLLVSTHFNDDFFIKQRLLASGYDVRPAETVFPGCSGFSVYTRGPHVVAHVRTERQYSQVSTSKTRLRALLIDRSLACPQLWASERAYFTIWSDDKRVTTFEDTIDPRLLGSMLPRLQPTFALSSPFSAGSLFRGPFWRVQYAEANVSRYELQGVFHSYRLSREELRAIARDAHGYLALPVQPNPANDDRIIGFEEFRAAYRARCRDPRHAPLSDLPLCMP